MLGAVIISMNPVVTALLAAMFLGEVLTRTRVVALALGVVAVLASCAGRLIAAGGVDPAVLLILVSLVSVAAGGVYQQKFCSGVDFRATAALQNAACILLGQRPDLGIAVGLVVGAAACFLNAKGSRKQSEDYPAGDRRGQHGVDPVHHSPVAGQ